jgi:transposase
VASDVVGKSGRDMVEAILAGEGDPTTLADLARGRLRAKLPLWRQALDGRVLPVQRLVLRHLLHQIDFLEAQLGQVTAEIAEQLAPVAEAVALLETIPGVGHTAATTLVAELGSWPNSDRGRTRIVAELGADSDRFPSAKHLASWAGLCPANKQSAGKRLGGKTTNGNTWLRAILGEVTWSIAHTSNT